MPPAGARNCRIQAFCPCCIRSAAVRLFRSCCCCMLGRSAICSLDVRCPSSNMLTCRDLQSRSNPRLFVRRNDPAMCDQVSTAQLAEVLVPRQLAHLTHACMGSCKTHFASLACVSSSPKRGTFQLTEIGMHIAGDLLNSAICSAPSGESAHWESE